MTLVWKQDAFKIKFLYYRERPCDYDSILSMIIFQSDFTDQFAWTKFWKNLWKNCQPYFLNCFNYKDGINPNKMPKTWDLTIPPTQIALILEKQ